MTSHNFSRTFKKPLRPYEKERIASELKTVGEFGLKNKREVWRVQYTLAKIRKAARILLTLPENSQKRIFESTALLRRLTKLGVLDETKQKLDYVLSLTVNDLLNRRFQTQLLQMKHARSIHNARVLVNHRHFAVKDQVVNQPAFLLWKDNERHVGHAKNSSIATGKPGRSRKKKLRVKTAKADDDSD